MSEERTPPPGLDATIQAGRDWLETVMYDPEGGECPCCTQRVKVYSRSIHASEARALILAEREHGGEWFHAPTFADTAQLGGSWAMLRRWGLIEENTIPREDGGRAGYWRITEHGQAFVRGEVKVPKYSRIFDNHLLDHVGEPVSIIEALGDRFDYRALMSR
ncbi:hypothetical protein I5G62_gp53 [Mycobacterium phage CRB2]|uniref:Uncharacterized protein n=1 Tax=Mycobacterium phage CRB2 TaxID=2483623 RepID=A0A455M3P7_9CAUD|nr:hypothetical protein I5G62_gp53 [Mycobacterium phage CRB2]AYP70039.1 hypothetical protein CRB2_53 [Mycobacterium phage CRB2]